MFGFFKKRSPTDRSLNANEQQEVDECIRGGLKMIGASRDDAKSTTAVQKRILAFIDGFRTQPQPEEAVFEAALNIGCLWGHTICRKLGWEWAYVSKDGHEIYAIVSPKREYVIFPILYAKCLLGDPQSDQTSMLLFNMLKAGEMPPSAEKGYLVIS